MDSPKASWVETEACVNPDYVESGSGKPFHDGPANLGETPYVMMTQGVRIRVFPSYDAESSRPQFGVYLYNYTIEIMNAGTESVQLLARHWIIRDGFGNAEHVVGEGVVGEKPNLAPGAAFTYTSACPLRTPTGSMEGTYQMRTATGQNFEARIPRFDLKHMSLVN